MRIGSIILATVLAMPLAAEQLCVEGARPACIDGNALAAADRDRSAVLFRDGALVATVVRAGHTEPELDSSASELPLRIRGANTAASGEMILRSNQSGTVWHVPIDGAVLRSLQRLVLPAGTYRVELALLHHRRGFLTIDTASGSAAVLSVGPAPVIRGVVRSAATKAPLAGARIALTPLAQSVVSDGQGRFTAEVETDWPDVLLVSHSGYGTRRIEIAHAAADTAVPPIELSRAATVVVRIDRKADKGPLEVELTTRDDLDTLHTVARRQLAQAQSSATFEDLEAASYFIIVRGDEPLECLAAKAFVGVGDRRIVSVSLPVAFAHGRITRGGQPYAGAKVTLERSGSGWQTTFVVPPDGELDSAIWDPGAFDLSIRDDDFRAPFAGSAVIDGSLAVKTFAIDVPDRRLRGRVVDERGMPVANARVVLRSNSVAMHPTIRATTSGTGQFEYSAVYAGAQELRASANGFLNARPILFTLAEEEKDHQERVVMPAGTPRTVDVVSAHGDAVVGALVVCASGGEVRSQTYTDSHGRSTAATPSAEASTLYVLPNEGSLAIARLAPDADPAERIRIVVPAGSSSLEIATLTTEGAAVPAVSLLMRYNGELIPPAVVREMHRYQGLPMATDSDGLATFDHIPPGVYELWPYRTEEEAGEIMSAALAAPINVNVATGPNKATVKFRRRS
jgi:hypothetical protein